MYSNILTLMLLYMLCLPPEESLLFFSLCSFILFVILFYCFIVLLFFVLFLLFLLFELYLLFLLLFFYFCLCNKVDRLQEHSTTSLHFFLYSTTMQNSTTNTTTGKIHSRMIQEKTRQDCYRTCGLGLNSEPVQNQFVPVQPSLSQTSQTMHTHQQLSVKVTQYIHMCDTIHTHQQLSQFVIILCCVLAYSCTVG